MDKNWLERTELLVGEEGIDKLRSLKVMVIGLGGVGSFAAEFLCRAGIGSMTIVDGDVVDLTNSNRQLHALRSTVGKSKAQLMGDRFRDIHPEMELEVIDEFLLPERMHELITPDYDWVLDCIDSIQPKLNLIQAGVSRGVKVLSSMGAGGRVDPSKVGVADISQTYNCPFAQQIRKGLRKLNIRTGVMAVYSSEPVSKDNCQLTSGGRFKKSFYGTISYIPALFGLHMAGWVVQEALENGKWKMENEE